MRFFLFTLGCAVLSGAAFMLQASMTPTLNEVEAVALPDYTKQGALLIGGIIFGLASMGYGSLALLAVLTQSPQTAARFEIWLLLGLVAFAIALAGMLILLI